jgi:hypothetical protein
MIQRRRHVYRLLMTLSYISEAAASLFDTRLNLHIVPKTQLVSLSSPVGFHEFPLLLSLNINVSQAFFYDWIDRTAFKKGKPLPEKIGSMQCFMHGYQGRHLLYDEILYAERQTKLQMHPISFEFTLGQGAQLRIHSTTRHIAQAILRNAS